VIDKVVGRGCILQLGSQRARDVADLHELTAADIRKGNGIFINDTTTGKPSWQEERGEEARGGQWRT